jgi:hypothetical protein
MNKNNYNLRLGWQFKKKKCTCTCVLSPYLESLVVSNDYAEKLWQFKLGLPKGWLLAWGSGVLV